MTTIEKINELKRIGKSKGSIAEALGISLCRLSVLLKTGTFSKLQIEKVNEIYEREMAQK